MAATVKSCRVCGSPYEPCRSARRVDGVFRWQEVACSEKCGAIYLARIRASRMTESVANAVDTITDETPKKRARRTTKKTETTNENTDRVTA